MEAAVSEKEGACVNEASVFFDKFARTFDTLYTHGRNPVMQWFDRTFRRDFFIRFSMTFELLGDLSQKSVLDIGCGPGAYMLEALRRKAARVTGIDPAPRMLEIAHDRISANGYSERSTLLQLSFPRDNLRDRFDFAIVMGVLDYVEDPISFMRELKHIVNSKAVISFPSRHWLRTPIRKTRYRIRKCPVFFYDEHEIRNLVQQAGFTQLSLTKIPGAGMDFVLCVAP
ncbi:MAG: class I SAM-dependent methyltransferase [bacterium]